MLIDQCSLVVYALLFMAVDKIKKHLLKLAHYTHLGPHFCHHHLVSGRMRATVNIFDFVRPYRCSLFYYPPEVSSMKYCCWGVFRKEYFRVVN